MFFVGGIVRDDILNIPTKDIDLLLVGNAIEFAKSIKDKIKIKSIHEDFCTVKLEYMGIEIDIASSRTEKYPYSGCLPVVDKIGVSIESDVLRRDFTINSMYYELVNDNNQINCNLIDLVSGLNDVNSKILKVLHPNSYIDDPTRIIRGLEFKYRFGFDFSNNDKKLIKEYLSKIDYSNMSISRNLKVIKKALNTSYSDNIFREIINNNYYKILSNDDIKVDFESIDITLSKFNLSQEEKVEFYLLILQNLDIDTIKFSNNLELFKIFSKYSLYYLAYYFYKTNDKNAYYFLKIKDTKIYLNGSDLISLGYKQGKIIGEILDSILLYKIEFNNYLNSKEEEIEFVKNRFPIL